MGRSGSDAWQVGPCIASREAGPTLMGDALWRLRDRPVLVDIPTANVEAMGLALGR